MPKTITSRIQYYTRKSNEYSKQRYDAFLRRTSKTAPSNRYNRLKCYKVLLNQRINEC